MDTMTIRSARALEGTMAKITFPDGFEAETALTPSQIELLRALSQAGWITAFLNLDYEGTNVKINVRDVHYQPEPISLEEARKKWRE